MRLKRHKPEVEFSVEWGLRSLNRLILPHNPYPFTVCSRPAAGFINEDEPFTASLRGNAFDTSPHSARCRRSRLEILL